VKAHLEGRGHNCPTRLQDVVHQKHFLATVDGRCPQAKLRVEPDVPLGQRMDVNHELHAVHELNAAQRRGAGSEDVGLGV
jgi:hypothetical protein